MQRSPANEQGRNVGSF